MAGTTKYNIETANMTNIILRNNGVGYDVKSNGAAHEYTHPNAQFYVDTVDDSDNLLYRFRPVSEPTKYLGVSGSQIVLKDVPNTASASDNSHDFYSINGVGSYCKYLYRNSPVGSPLFMSTDSNDDVILAGNSSNDSFLLRPVTVTSINFNSFNTTPKLLPAGEFEEFFEEMNTGARISVIIEEESIPGKLVITERISVSEE